MARPVASTGIPWVDAILRAAQSDPMAGLGPQPGVSILMGNPALRQALASGSPPLASFLRRIPAVVDIRAGTRGPTGFKLRTGEAVAFPRPAPGIARAAGPAQDVRMTVNPWSRFVESLLGQSRTPRLLAHEGIHAAYFQKNPQGLPPARHVPAMFEHFRAKYPDLERFAAQYAERNQPYGTAEAVVEGMAREATKRARPVQ